MKKNFQNDGYELIDSGDGRKLERFGAYTFSRPCAAAVWHQRQPVQAWEDADGIFDRDGGNAWVFNTKIPEFWNICVEGITFKLATTNFGHVGIFPEQASTWNWLKSVCRPGMTVLNLFAYSGGATLAAAKAGANVCHLDASRGMTQRARENAALNSLNEAAIRWIVDDVMKFLDREIRRGNKYDAVIMDPPSFGRGKSREIFKIESSIMDLVGKCRKILSPRPEFIMISCHTPSFTPAILHNILTQGFEVGGVSIESGEMFLRGASSTMRLASGTYALWSCQQIRKGTTA